MNIYLGTFLISLITLTFEVTLVRLLSVVSWYYLGFFAVSTAMLGMTAGATTVYLKPNWFLDKKFNINIAHASLGYSLITPFALIIICITPMVLKPSLMSLCALFVVTIACMLPFYFSGMVITAILTKCQLPIGRLYASDLLGASFGCLFVLILLNVIDAASLILLSGSIAVIAALSFVWHDPIFYFKRVAYLIFAILSFFAIVNSFTSYGIRPFIVKGSIEDLRKYELEKWNSLSRVVVYKKSEGDPQYWGKSPAAPKDEKVSQYSMNIDGCAGTVLRRFSTIEDIKHLRFDLVNIAYYLRPKGGACIIGVGGARDIQSAFLFGHKRIVGIDINPIFIDLLKNKFRDFAGIAKRKEVVLVVDEARSYLSRTKEKYSVIQMSLIDTWASTTAGAFSLSENSLYTLEGWKVFLNRLKDDGIFTVSRWYNPENLSETGRIISLAVATLLDLGIKNPQQHIAILTTENLSTLLLSRQPFSDEDISSLKDIASELQFSLDIYPGMVPTEEVFHQIVNSKSFNELNEAIEEEILNFKPTTDENPYFFNMLRIKHLNPLTWRKEVREAGILRGNLIANIILGGLILILLFLTLVTIVLPLLFRSKLKKNKSKNDSILVSAAIYFSLIGAGFMFVEIALIQRLSVFLGHPVYALGILLFTIIVSASIGSFLSEHLPLTRIPWISIFPLAISLIILIMCLFLLKITLSLVSSSMIIKIFLSILIIFPLGMLLGVCFPTGMRLVKAIRTDETPWYWALNGIFSVLCSALAVFISIHFGISTSFYIGSICYLLLLPCLFYLHKANTKPHALY
ncbi:MAG: hypothetical protein JXB26_20130 [Candidatus Aminicenantes bacterium]|nr:hypothetical protein [Candidatus Aminicenantes bacterium]